jgi:hypothetical protein
MRSVREKKLGREELRIEPRKLSNTPANQWLCSPQQGPIKAKAILL